MYEKHSSVIPTYSIYHLLYELPPLLPLSWVCLLCWFVDLWNAAYLHYIYDSNPQSVNHEECEADIISHLFKLISNVSLSDWVLFYRLQIPEIEN